MSSTLALEAATAPRSARQDGDRRAEVGRFSVIWRMIPDLALASVLLNLLSLALPLALLQVYDRIIPNQSISTLGLLVGGVAVALLLDAVIKMLRAYVTGWAGSRFEYLVSCAGFRRLLQTGLSDYESEGASAHLERLQTSAQVRDFYSGQAVLALFDLPFTIVYIGLIAMIAGKLALVPLTVLLVFSAVALINGHFLRDHIRRRTQFDERRFSFIIDTLNGIHTIKTMALEPMMQRRYEMLLDTNVESGFEGARHSIIAMNIGSLFSQISTVSMVAFGAAVVIEGGMTPGALAACIMLAGRSLGPVQSALSTWVRFQSFLVARKQLDKLFQLRPAANVGKPSLPPIEGLIELDNVGFRFPKAGQPLFSGLSLTVMPGECVAIVGDSGSGKTSLMGLMAGMVAPTGGRVVIDGHDLAEYSPSSLPRQIAYLPQQATLFNGTILENLTMFDPSLESAAYEVAKLLGLDRVVAGMRNGYETAVGNSAAEAMPGGIKQRIAIARALVHNPKVVLFDEANIAIDSAGDEALRHALETFKGKRTMVLVTHRPSLLKLADRAFAIEDGKLVPRERAQGGGGGFGGNTASAVALAERPPADHRLASNLLTRFKNQSDLSMCLVGLLTALDWRGNLRQLAEALPHFAETLDLTGFQRVMANLNYTCKTADAALRDIDPRLLPCVFLPRDGDAKVLIRFEEGSGFIGFDGAKVEMEALPADRTRGTLLLFQAAEPPPRGAERESWVRRVMLRLHPLAWLGLLLSIGINVLALAAPVFVMMTYDRILPSGDLDLIGYLAFGVGIAMAVEFSLRRLRARILSYVGARSEFLIGTAVFQRILALPAWSTEQVAVGGQVARIKDFETMRDMFVGPVALLFYEFPATIVYLIAITVINPWLLLVLGMAMVGYVLLAVTTRPGMAQRVAISGRHASQRREFLSDALGKMRAIKHSGAEGHWLERYRTIAAKAVASDFETQQYSGRAAIFAQTIGTLTGLGALTTCVLTAFSGSTGMGAVVASMIITWRLVGPMQTGFLSVATLVRVWHSVRQIDNLMRLRTDRDTSSLRKAPPAFRGEVQFARVSFRYSADADPALLGVTFRAQPGQVVAVAGPNGAGKSTLIKLITGIYVPQAGSVRIDNIDIRQIDVGDLRSVISYAPQRCDIFYGTIAQNLRFAHPTASEEEMRWAADMAGMLDDIMALPQGFETRVFDGQADQLPHGFRQRLSLARAYLKPAPVMIFDEPGNALDFEADRRFQQAVQKLRGSSTIFIVSHRPSHMRIADAVIYMEDGYVRQVGTFDQLEKLIMGTLG